MISNYKVKINDSCNYKVSITDIQNKYKFKLFCAGADLTDYYTKEQVDQSQNTQDILIDNLLNQIPTGTASGETINITDSSSLPIKDIQEAGNTYQETTTGKNLFDGVLELGNYNSTTGEKVANSNYIINKNLIPVNELTNYKISLNGNGVGMYVFEYKSDYSYNLTTRKTIDANSYLTTNSGTKYIAFRTIDVNTDTTSKVQVEIGTTASYWEKYTGGNPAPNPDYPQTITNVTGTNTIKIVGKNLFDKSNANVLNAYFTATSPTITSSSSDRTIYIPCEPNTTYTISKNLVGYGRAVGYTSTIPAISSPVEGTINISANSASGTITTGANANYLVMRAFNTGQDTLTYQQVLASIQVEKSSTASTYEAYKEKSYTINLGSIELCKIGDYKDRIYKSTGKNLFDKNNANEVTGYFNTGTSTISSSSQSKIIYIPCNPNTTYTVSKITSSRFFVGYTKTTPALGVEVFGVLGGNNKTTPTTITTSNDAKYLVAFIYHSNYDTSITYQQILDSIQIEENSTATTYEGYGKKWYLEKNINKVVFNGSEYWYNAGGNAPFGLEITYSLITISNDIPPLVYCDKFYPVSQSATWSVYDSLITASSTSTSTKIIRIRYTSISGLENFKTWLSSNNVTLYYVLATPTTTEITDTTLKGQLDALINSTTYKTTTNITIDTTNQKPTLTLTYRKDLETLIGG